MSTQSHCPISLPSISELLLSIDSSSVRPLSLQGDPPSRATSHVRQSTTIDMLPDDVLLEIFDFCQENFRDFIGGWTWHLLVHVCRRWRQIIFESPHRLNLQILCMPRTSVRKSLDIWPAFPIIIVKDGNRLYDEDNVIAALKHPDRVCRLWLDNVTSSQLEKISTLMQEPFSVLTHLRITAKGRNALVLPDGFLGGSAPCLRSINLFGIPFPALPTLLLSTSDLVTLELCDIPSTGYIPPEAMVACLAALPRLHTFIIEFQSATPHPDRIRPPPVTRTVLPALTSFKFQGASEYLEVLVARIDGPRLNRISIDYLIHLVDFQVAQLTTFIDRSVGPELTLFRHAEIAFSSGYVVFNTDRHPNNPDRDWGPAVTVVISCEGIDRQVSHMARVLGHFSATLSNVVHLTLLAYEVPQLEGTDEAEWVSLLQQISTVQTLHISRELAEDVALALEDITEMVTEMLPSLDLIYLADQPASCIEKFIAVRQLSGRPVTTIDTETEFDKRLKSYVSE